MANIYLTVPGVTNSGPQHWQTLWEKQYPEKFRRIEQSEWDTPECRDWIETIEREIRKYAPESVVLIAHSLGCITVAHWARKYKTVIRGALLVAPSDVEALSYTFNTQGFAPIPLERLPFQSLVVASSNDRYISPERARQFAKAWGSELIEVGAQGHLNADAGFGEWKEGLALLEKFD